MEIGFVMTVMFVMIVTKHYKISVMSAPIYIKKERKNQRKKERKKNLTNNTLLKEEMKANKSKKVTIWERKLFLYRQAFQLLREENKKLKEELTSLSLQKAKNGNSCG